MASAMDFAYTALAAGPNSRLLSRIALNLLEDPSAYPVDISELRSLNAQNMAMLASFLCSLACAKPDAPERTRKIVDDIHDWLGDSEVRSPDMTN